MDEEEYEEEECLVLVELNGIIDPDFLHSCGDQCKVIGVDSDTPVLQMGHYIFEGHYEDTLGTCVIFEEQETDNAECSGSDVEDASKSANKTLNFYDMTSKKLNMTRIFLKEKSSRQEDEMEEPTKK